MKNQFKRVTRVKCIVGGCHGLARQRHAVCRYHLILEAMILGGGALLGVAAMIAAVLHWGGR